MKGDCSSLRFYSYGLVTKDKERGSHDIRVVPVEVRFSQQELNKDGNYVDMVEHNIRNGVDYIAMPVTNSVRARWIDFNSNRITSPDVKVDELVLIWRLGDTNVYFWQDRNIANVKRLETVVYAFSADPKKPLSADLSNAYYIMVSSHDKHMTIKTSKSNGEYCGFTVQINGGDGRAVIESTNNNVFWLDAKEREIGIKNSDNSVLKVDKKTIYGYAKDSINFKSKHIGFESETYQIDCDDYTANSKNHTVNTNTYECNADDWSVKATSANIHASNIGLTAPSIGLNGSVSIGGGGSAGSAARSGGSTTCKITAETIDMKVSVFAIDAKTTDFKGNVVMDNVTIKTLFAANFSHGGGKCC